MDLFTLGWIIIGISAGLLETVALINNPAGTLSAHLWAWLGIRDGAARVNPKWTLRLARTAFLTATLWFATHIVTGGWV